MNGVYRPIAGFDGYVVSAERVVWSVGRTVRTKGGATRTTAAKQLKPDEKNRVALRRDGKTVKVRVDELVAQEFPPTHHYVAHHRIVLPCRWCEREFVAFVTDYCESPSTLWPDLFRCPHCTTAVTRLPDYFPTFPQG